MVNRRKRQQYKRAVGKAGHRPVDSPALYGVYVFYFSNQEHARTMILTKYIIMRELVHVRN